MVRGIPSAGERSVDESLPCSVSFPSAVGEVNAVWLKPDQRVVYWSGCVRKGYSHSVPRQDPVFSRGSRKHGGGRSSPLLLGLRLNHFQSLAHK